MPLPPFQLMVDEHGPAVGRFVRASVGADGAEDCMQEALLAALRAYPRLRPGSNLRAWLFAVARSKVVDHQRAAARRARASAALPEPAVDPPREPEPDLWARVRGLPPKQRTAIALRFAGDMDHAEIGRVLGCSADAARRNVHEGLKKLRRDLDEQP